MRPQLFHPFIRISKTIRAQPSLTEIVAYSWSQIQEFNFENDTFEAKLKANYGC